MISSISRLNSATTGYRSIILLLFAIFSYELIFELCEEIFEILVISFECIEYGMEGLIEHSFHTSRYDSQLFTFYFLTFSGSILLLFAIRSLPGMWRALTKKIQDGCSRYKKHAATHWQKLSILKKIKMVVIYITGATGLLFLI